MVFYTERSALVQTVSNHSSTDRNKIFCKLAIFLCFFLLFSLIHTHSKWLETGPVWMLYWIMLDYFLGSFSQERRELAERVMITRLTLYGRWMKVYITSLSKFDFVDGMIFFEILSFFLLMLRSCFQILLLISKVCITQW